MWPATGKTGHVDTDTTPANSGTDNDASNASQENWQARYTGLQRVLSKREAELADLGAKLDSLSGDRETADAELAAFRAERDAAAEEAALLAQYSDLKARFEEDLPNPVGNSPVRDDWTRPRRETDNYGTRERKGDSQGWPT